VYTEIRVGILQFSQYLSFDCKVFNVSGCIVSKSVLLVVSLSVKTLQSKQKYCKNIISSLSDSTKNKYYKKSRKYIKDKLLYLKNWSPYGIKYLLVIPTNLVNTVLKSYH